MKSLSLILVMLILLTGCDSFPADAVISPGSFEATIIEIDPKTGTPIHKKAIVKTPGYKGPGSGATTFNVQTPAITFDGITASATDSGLTLKGAASNPWTYLYLIGGLGILGGLIYTQFGGLGSGLGIAAASAVFLVFIHFVSTMPMLAFGILALVIGGGVFWFIQSKKGKDTKRTLTDIVKSIDKVGGDAAAAIKKRMEKVRHNKDVVKKVVDEVKNGDKE